jgi:hypothetical protein
MYDVRRFVRNELRAASDAADGRGVVTSEVVSDVAA